MKVLVLATNYPDLLGNISLFYIHTRCKYYVENNIDVEVINFSANKKYVIDGVKVITLQDYIDSEKKEKEYDILISHAPNLRQHYKFLKKYGANFEKHIFFFHGHEVLKINKVYSKPYKYMKNRNRFLQNIYDSFKLKVWHYYFLKNNDKSYYVFVSNWMKKEFLKWTKIDESLIKEHVFITYNSVGEEFEKDQYNYDSEKKYDFITVRGNIDGSKYCIDLVNDLAYRNPDKKFLVIGKGRFFDINQKASNIEFIKENYTHNQIIEKLNQSKCALMPTRTDAQGLMACEMATFGIPLITSNIEVCHEIFDEFKNVKLIANDAEKVDLQKVVEEIEPNNSKCYKFLQENTINKEIHLLKEVMEEKCEYKDR